MKTADKIGFLAILAALIVINFLICTGVHSATKKSTDSPIVIKCKADLAKRMNLPVDFIKTIKVIPVTIPDASLGIPERDKVYIQKLTPGLRIILESKNHQYLYMTSAKSFKYGGPVNTWASSILYTVPVPNEPNLNGDLYQCSFIGTNHTRLASEITDYYPQDKGVILATSRTSRSGFDLLYIDAKKPMKSTVLFGAFHIGPAALNNDHSKWAAIVRIMVGSGWYAAVSDVGKNDGNAIKIALPEGVRPENIAWSGDDLMILTKDGEALVCWKTSSKSGNSDWKKVGGYEFPALPDYMLNKSESLEIKQVTKDNHPMPKYDTPYVEVARVWFTGDTNVIAELKDLKMTGSDFFDGQYALIWGEKNSKQVFYAVDIWSKEVISGYIGNGRNIKPFKHPVLRSPLSLKK
ncbi:MAG: hypothetical protein ACYC0V_00770 [Armatimonadota bacterium]